MEVNQYDYDYDYMETACDDGSSSNCSVVDDYFSDGIMVNMANNAPFNWMNWILLHLTVLGIIFCFAILPIFGRPRRIPPDDVSDFAKHIAAVGDLLERGGDRSFARQRVQAYTEMAHPRSSGEK